MPDKFEQNLDKAKILVVEDNQVQSRQLKNILEKNGFNVSLCSDVMEAMEYLQNTIPDLVISDIIMPQIDGYEFCRYFQEISHLKDIPIMLITELAQSDKLEKAFAEGAMDFISKPIQEIELLARAKALLRLRFEMEKRKRRESELVKLNYSLNERTELLERLSYIDGLTNIANRRYFDEVFAKEWKRALRNKTYISLLMIDIDNFKTFNDTYGHQVGDDCLKQICTTFESMLKRPSDFLARYGGEEFVSILPDTDLEGAILVGERLRESTLILGIPHSASNVNKYVTVSIGIATMLPSKTSISSKLITEADMALYDAKQYGRNQVKWKFVK